LRNTAKNHMQTLIDSMIEYIDDNASSYPDYNKGQDVNQSARTIGGWIMDVSENCDTTDFRDRGSLSSGSC